MHEQHVRQTLERAKSTPSPDQWTEEDAARLQAIKSALRDPGISSRDQRVIEAYYGLTGESPRSLLDIAEAFSVSRHTVRMSRARTLEKVCALLPDDF